MLYTSKELTEKYNNFYGINQLVKDGKLFKVAHGVYSDVDPRLAELECLFAQYPNAILSMQSAYAFYGLTDYIPEKYWVATKQNAHKISSDKVSQMFITGDIFDIGKQMVTTKYGTINIYDKERLLIELFRLKSKFEYSFFKDVINSYRKLASNGELDNYKIAKYCSIFRNGKSIMAEIQKVIL